MESPSDLQKTLQCHPLIARLLWARGFQNLDELEKFLNPRLSDLPSPTVLFDLEKATDRVERALAEGEKITIYGDYDVDGTCGASLLVEFFRGLGVEVDCYQPDRFREGYGVHVKAVEALADSGTRVLITVDCGITAVDPARVACERGVDMIILDHHKLGKELPSAFAIVNPQRPEDTSGLKNLCGAAVAFFFAMGLRARLREKGYFATRAEPNLAQLLDLVAVATVADVVSLRGVNRILVSHGLRILSTKPRPGFKAILEAAGVTGRVTPTHCGFVLGPRINAAGRLKSARAAFELLTCTDTDQSRVFADELETTNRDRRKAQDEVLEFARAQALVQLRSLEWKERAEKIPAAEFGPWPRALVLAPAEGEHWHEGVVGIVATKIVEEFGRPAFVLSSPEVGKLKGSVRSLTGIDILSMISAESVAKHLTNFGGHAHAGGVGLESAQLEIFREALNTHMALVTDASHFKREQRFDLEVGLNEIDEKLLVELESLGPFGAGFPEPVFKVNVGENDFFDTRLMKEKHVKWRFNVKRGAKKSAVDAVWFNAVNSERTSDMLMARQALSVWVSPQWNEWQGRKTLQLQIRHAEGFSI